MFGRRNAEGDPGSDRSGEPGIRETLGPKLTIVGRGAQVEGTLVSVDSISIDGKAKG